MNQIKKYFVVIVLILLGCTADERPPEAAPPGETGGPDSSNSDNTSTGYDGNYTISIGNDSESVYVYYSLKNAFPVKDEMFFRLDEGECLRVTNNQFNHLSIFASKGSILEGEKSIKAKDLVLKDDDYMPLCNKTFKCSPNNYTAVLRSVSKIEYLTLSEQFVMLPVDDANVFATQCDYFYNLDQWMEFKVKQYVLRRNIDKEKVDASLKTQIEEWTQ